MIITTITISHLEFVKRKAPRIQFQGKICQRISSLKMGLPSKIWAISLRINHFYIQNSPIQNNTKMGGEKKRVGFSGNWIIRAIYFVYNFAIAISIWRYDQSFKIRCFCIKKPRNMPTMWTQISITTTIKRLLLTVVIIFIIIIICQIW